MRNCGGPVELQNMFLIIRVKAHFYQTVSNLTEVIPGGGCPDSDTLRSRDCVTGDSLSDVEMITIHVKKIIIIHVMIIRQ